MFNAETEESLHVSICDIARDHMLDQVDHEYKCNGSQLSIEQILKNIYTFVNSGKVLVVFQNAGAFLKTSNVARDIFSYLDQYEKSENFFYVITSSEPVCESKPPLIDLGLMKETKANECINMNKTASIPESAIEYIARNTQLMHYNLVIIKIVIGLVKKIDINNVYVCQNTQEHKNIPNIPNIPNILCSLLKTVLKEVTNSFLSNVCPLFCILHSGEVDKQIIYQLLAEENIDQADIDLLLEKLDDYNVITVNISKLITVHDLIAQAFTSTCNQKEVEDLLFKITNNGSFKRYVESTEPQMIQILHIFKMLLAMDLKKFDKENISEIAMKICEILREKYNVELYDKFSDSALQKFKKEGIVTHFVDMLTLQRLDFLTTFANTNYVTEINGMIEAMKASTMTTGMKIHLLKYCLKVKEVKIRSALQNEIIRELLRNTSEAESTKLFLQLYLQSNLDNYVSLTNKRLRIRTVVESYSSYVKKNKIQCFTLEAVSKIMQLHTRQYAFDCMHDDLVENNSKYRCKLELSILHLKNGLLINTVEYTKKAESCFRHSYQTLQQQPTVNRSVEKTSR
jgi:hypothetical protein